jgi:ParB family chromosome partitioning protein
MGHARALLALADPAQQLRLRDQILAESWSVRATEADIQKRRPAPPKARRRSVELMALEDALQRALMTRVRITGTERKGRIEIMYATPEELERLSTALGAQY